MTIWNQIGTKQYEERVKWFLRFLLRIENNKIHDVGRIWLYNAGITIMQSGKNMVSNKEIYNMPYNGISITGVGPNSLGKKA